MKPNIKLNTGGQITIEKTEALTSIDVNSGGFNKVRSTRDAILWVNLAATKEIINQLFENVAKYGNFEDDKYYNIKVFKSLGK